VLACAVLVVSVLGPEGMSRKDFRPNARIRVLKESQLPEVELRSGLAALPQVLQTPLLTLTFVLLMRRY
jgi:hypothetical protein